MSTADLLKKQIGLSRMVFDGTIADISEDQCAKIPGGNAHSIGASVAHAVMSEDFVLNGMVRGGQPLMMTTFAGKTGVSEPPPPPGDEAASLAWANRVTVDVPALKDYAKAVYASTDEYLSSLSDADLDKEIEFPQLGKQSLASMITLFAIVHPSNHIGEVAALKGMGGAKGYPF
ncbi:MAG: DinB family protein [Chloroflexota bacterium]